MKKIIAALKSAWSNDQVRRVVHTFWQAFLAALIMSLAGVHDISTAKAAILAAVAAGFAAVKALYIVRKAKA